MSNITIQEFFKQNLSEEVLHTFGQNITATDYRIIIDVEQLDKYEGRSDSKLQDDVVNSLREHFKKNFDLDFPNKLFKEMFIQHLKFLNNPKIEIVDYPTFELKDENGVKTGRTLTCMTIKTDVIFKPNDNLVQLCHECITFIAKYMSKHQVNKYYFLNISFTPPIIQEDYSYEAGVLIRFATT